jgi:hypothetical protein
MRKYIGVMLCCFFVAAALIPGTYSLWRQDLGIWGHVQITVDKEKKGKAKVGNKEKAESLEPGLVDEENDCLGNNEAISELEGKEREEEEVQVLELAETEAREDSGDIAGE